ncbi:MAG: secondary thiamine-phosphate synthase enzyme YjbQ [Patescibacteria group bacterium]|jgi:secondary thiamine-phosphate synthase enzyme
MAKLTIKTKTPKEVIDITDKVNEILAKEDEREGLVNLFVTHTTAALTVADLDPGTDLDMLDAFEAMCPKLNYRHPHNPEHAPDHIMSALIGATLTLPFNQNGLILGDWQRVVLIELNGPRDRRIIVSLI